MLKSIFTPLLALLSFCCSANSDTTIIRSHLIALTKTERSRTYYNVQQLNQTAAYIEKVFKQYADSVWIQEYPANGNIYRNVVCSFGLNKKKRIVIGAHYDVCGEQEGADDNASGVAGLLELARMLRGQPLPYRIDLVAFSLEEPPYFRTQYMGSYVHAQSLAEAKTELYGMICFDMIGYFSQERKSQSYPLGLLSLFYGKKGNYITLIKRFGGGSFARRFARRYKSCAPIRAKKFSAPAKAPGVSYSDHANYWSLDYSALLITDTSIYRNRNYHSPGDTIETLDLASMAKVIDGVLMTLKRM